MIQKLIEQAIKNGQRKPFFILSNNQIDISGLDIESNFVLKEYPENIFYLVSYNNIPKDYKWLVFNCEHGLRYRGGCEKCKKHQTELLLKHNLDL